MSKRFSKMSKYIYRFILLLLAISVGLFPWMFHKDPQQEKEQKQQLLKTMRPINFDLLKIENYKETPFTRWGSQVPLGIFIEFDLSGEYLNELHLDFSYFKIMNEDLILSGNCIPENAEIKHSKKIAKGVYRRQYDDSYTLSDSASNHITYKCYTNYLFDVFHGIPYM